MLVPNCDWNISNFVNKGSFSFDKISFCWERLCFVFSKKNHTTNCVSLMNLNMVKIFCSNHWSFIVVGVARKINFWFQGIADLFSCVHPYYNFFCCVDGKLCQFAWCSTLSFAFHIWFMLSWSKAQRFYFKFFFLDCKWEVFCSFCTCFHWANVVDITNNGWIFVGLSWDFSRRRGWTWSWLFRKGTKTIHYRRILAIV